MARRFPKEFRTSAVKLVLEQGLSARQAAADLGIKVTTLLYWIKLYRSDHGLVNAQEDLRRQIKRLQAEVDQLRVERDILKKAAAYFAREQRP